MATRISEVELGRLEMSVLAHLIGRLNLCRKKVSMLSRFFFNEMKFEKRGQRHGLDAPERRLIRELHKELGIMYERVSELMRAEGMDVKT